MRWIVKGLFLLLGFAAVIGLICFWCDVPWRVRQHLRSRRFTGRHLLQPAVGRKCEQPEAAVLDRIESRGVLFFHGGDTGVPNPTFLKTITAFRVLLQFF